MTTGIGHHTYKCGRKQGIYAAHGLLQDQVLRARPLGEGHRVTTKAGGLGMGRLCRALMRAVRNKGRSERGVATNKQWIGAIHCWITMIQRIMAIPGIALIPKEGRDPSTVYRYPNLHPSA